MIDDAAPPVELDDDPAGPDEDEFADTELLLGALLVAAPFCPALPDEPVLVELVLELDGPASLEPPPDPVLEPLPLALPLDPPPLDLPPLDLPPLDLPPLDLPPLDLPPLDLPPLDLPEPSRESPPESLLESLPESPLVLLSEPLLPLWPLWAPALESLLECPLDPLLSSPGSPLSP